MLLFSTKVPEYRNLNKIFVYKSALKQNLEHFKDILPGKSICPVLKSNAYGHGLIEVAKILDGENADFFLVDSLFEAYKLKKSRIKTPILILGYTSPENLKTRLPFHFTASNKESLETLHRLKLPIHLEIDTGMNRMGFTWKNFEQDLIFIKKMNPKIEGFFTHLACADSSDDAFTNLQIDRFLTALKLFKEAGFNPKYIHVGNSAGAKKTNRPEFNMLRLGISLYKNALRFDATLINLQNLQKGETVGYSATYTAEENQTIGIVSAGYYEGVPISLSNKGFMEINGHICPIVGRVCMNHTMIRLPNSADLKADFKVGSAVTIYSNEDDAKNSVEAQAKLAGTISYELIARLSESTKRQIQE
ncbi:MAG: alanine racemase [Candidatus Gracilibacteria bacterium]